MKKLGAAGVVVLAALSAGTVEAQAPIPAAEIARAYAADKAGARQRYAGKPIVITGNIGRVLPGHLGSNGLILDGLSETDGGLLVFIPAADAIKALKPALKIALRCVITLEGDVVDRCTVVATAPGVLPQPPKAEPAKATRARDLFKEFDTDKDAAIAKWGGKQVQVTGTIGRVNFDQFGLDNLILDGDSTSESLLVWLASGISARSLKIGETVTLDCKMNSDGPVAAECRIVGPAGAAPPPAAKTAVPPPVAAAPPAKPEAKAPLPAQAPPKSAPAAAVPARQIFKDFAGNKDAAITKWGSKVVVVTGKVGNVAPAEPGLRAGVWLDGKDNSDAFFAALDTDVGVDRVKVGDTVTLRCRMVPDFVLGERCRFLAPFASPPIAWVRVPARELADDFEKDDAAATRKWGGKRVLITGKIGWADDDRVGFREREDAPVFPTDLDKSVSGKNLKPGDELQLYCEIPAEGGSGRSCTFEP